MNSARLNKSATVLLWALLVVFTAISVWLGAIHLTQPELNNALVYPRNGPLLPELTLSATDESPFDRRRFRGRWSLVFFGYTRCPDICPTTLQTMHRAAEQIRRNDNVPQPQYLFISVDSRRDNVRQLKSYVNYFDKDFIGLTGDAQSLKKLSAVFDAPFNYYTVDRNPEYEYVNHSASIYVVSPDARLFAQLPAPHRAGQIAEDFTAIWEYYGDGLVSSL